MQLPGDLLEALEQRLARQLTHQSPRDLGVVSDKLSRRYREGHGRGQPRAFLQSQNDVLAYAAYRLPATFAAIYSALEEVRARRPDWRPRTLLDVGAGPATAAWAATTIWPHLEQITLLEREASMIDLGKDLVIHASSTALRQARWWHADLSTMEDEAQSYDLIIGAYVLGELSSTIREALVTRLWPRAEVLLLVEPGTPRGFALVRAARDHLLPSGAAILAPCPHVKPCPIPENDWCHFARRVSRTKLQRDVKGATLSYEDEKFSYAALAHTGGLPIQGRVIRHPQKRGGHVRLDLCTPEGLKQSIVSRRAGQQYRMAQDLEWGSALNEPL